VARRLNDVIVAERARRVSSSVKSGGVEAARSWQHRKALGTFGEDLTKRKSRWALAALAAAVVAAVVGFGAYLISAGAGLNEPPVVAAVNSRDLGADARALEQTSGGLNPHRFPRPGAVPGRLLTAASPGLPPRLLTAPPHCWSTSAPTGQPKSRS
jgi:hypothetical protein